MDAVLGSRPATKPKLVVSSAAGIQAESIDDSNADEDNILSLVSVLPDPGLEVSMLAQ